jgi:hypothetical protein
MGGRIPLPRTGGAPERTARIVGELAVNVKAPTVKLLRTSSRRTGLQTEMKTLKPVERAAYAVGSLLFASGLIHAAILLVSDGSWEGPVSLRKAATFGLSFGLTLINVTYVASFISMRDRSRNLLLGSFAAACVLETALVSMQAWRGVPSHFNMETPFDAVVAQALAIGGFALVAVIVALTVTAFRDRAALPSSLRLAIKSGLVALVGAQIVGGLMIATGVRLVIGGDPQAAYAIGGWLKLVHGVLMHGILVLPLLAWATAAAQRDEPGRVRTVRIGVTLYALVAVAAVLVSLSDARLTL